jgi:hypothetical protein
LRGYAIAPAANSSRRPEGIFTHVSGIKTVMPSNPYDAKGLLIAAIESDDPVVFFEPKRIYNGPFDGDPEKPGVSWASHPKGEVPEGYYTVPLGTAEIALPGDELTIITYGTLVHVAIAAAEATPWRHSTSRHWRIPSRKPAAAWSRTKQHASAAMAPNSLRRYRKSASTISKHRSAVSPVGIRLIRTHSSGNIFRA